MMNGSSVLMSGLAVVLALTAGCGDNEREGTAPSTMKELHQRLGPTPSMFTIDAAHGGRIRGESIVLDIPPSSIIDRGGAPLDIDTNGDGALDAHLVTGPVTISLREFQSVGDMVRGNRPTMATDGTLLETSGSFELDAHVAGGSTVVIQGVGPVKFRRWPNARSDVMRQWLAGPDDPSWAQPGDLALIPPVDNGGAYLFNSLPFGSIGHYTAANCDAIANLGSDHMTLRVKLAPELTEEAGVFFLPEGINTAAKLYVKKAWLPGFVSYADTMPVGVRGKLVVVALLDNNYYLFHDDAFVIPTGTLVDGVNEETITVTPVLTSEADFVAYMDSL